MKKKILAMILTVALLLSIAPTGLFKLTVNAATTSNTQEFMGGSGTVDDPYFISNRTHLNNVRNYLNAHFKLICDITFDDEDFASGGDFYNSGAGFIPIGDKSSAFRGTFDGNGHTIKNIHITASSSENAVYAGLFGYNGGTIKNLGITDSAISITTSYTSAFVGAIAGYNYGTILNCFNTSAVSATSYYSSSNIIPSYYVGGIVGQNSSGTITNCYNTGAVSSFASHKAYSGGIAGNNARTITNCYNTGAVAARSEYSDYSACSGGIVGINSNNIENCYNIGITWATADLPSDIGGIVGVNSGTTTSCFYADIVSKGVGSGTDTAMKCTSDELRQKSTFFGFDFENTWMFDETLEIYRAPVLKSVKHIEALLEENTTEFAGGCGTYYKPYLISNKTHLSNVKNYLNAYFKLLCDIDFNGASLEPIGRRASTAFAGFFDGNGYAVKNLHINISSKYEESVGLFGYNSGTIVNLGMIDGSVKASSPYDVYAGGIAGYNSGVIENCYNESAVSAYTSSKGTYYEAYAGGIVGYNNGTVTNSYNTGMVSVSVYPKAYTGGIAGCNTGTIANGYNSGVVSAISSDYNAYSGGVAAYNTGAISDCYNTGGGVSSTGYGYAVAGGLAGYNTNGTINNCYNIGAVSATYTKTSGTGAFAGGVAGYNSGTTTNCYYLDNISGGAGTGTSTAIKCTAEQLKQQTTFSGFNFEKIWIFDEKLENHPYPILKNIAHHEPENKTDFAGGHGTMYSPYLISNITHLNNVRNYLGAHFKLLCDIDLNGTSFTPIGATSAFTGTFDGNGYIIKNINISISKYSSNVSAGLFGHNSGTIKNLGITGGQISAEVQYSYSSYSATAGGIAASNSGLIMNCYNAGTAVTALSETSEASAGGITVYNSGTIMNCYSMCSVSAKATDYCAWTGGIASRNAGTITNCYNTGSITATGHNCAWAGGIVGENNDYESVGTITNCYNIGEISSSDYAGGIAGESASTSASASGKYISNCYYLNTISKGVGQGSGSTTRCAESSLKKQSTFVGLDFGFVWEIDSSTGYEYPQLIKKIRALSISGQPTNNTYVVGLNPDLAGALLKVEYELANVTKEKFVQITLDMLEDFNNETVGIQEVHVSYSDLVSANTLVLNGLARAITSIKVTTTPTKLTYVYGQPTNFNGTKITAYYNDNTSEVVSSGLSFEYDSVVGTVPVTVSYKGFTDAFNITVKERIVQQVTFTEPTKVSSLEGEELDLRGGYFKVVFVSDDNYTETISLDMSMISGYDKDTPGYQTVTATYAGKSKTFVVRVIAADYVIVFKDWDGSILSNGIYHKGDPVIPPADPSRMSDDTYTYVFAGWDQTVVNCTGNATYTATYTPVYIDYTVVFKNWDGNVINTQTYHYGDEVTEAANPARAADNTYSYVFSGWDKAVVDCKGNATYTATYTPIFIDYTVVFKDWNGDVLSTKTYHYGDKVTVPINPTRVADKTYTYTFNDWDNAVVNCVGDATYTATYTSTYIDYTVVFKNWNGDVLSTKTYHYGDKVMAPGNPTKAADNTYTYIFAGWDSDVVNCTGDATYTATYASEYINYTVTFQYEDGTVMKQYALHYGDSVVAPANPAAPDALGNDYEFAGWDKEITDCQGDTVYTAVFVRKYTPGDLDGKEGVTSADAIYLLYHTLLGSGRYPVNQPVDYNKDGTVSSADAIYLLYHTLLGAGRYPIE